MNSEGNKLKLLKNVNLNKWKLNNYEQEFIELNLKVYHVYQV